MRLFSYCNGCTKSAFMMMIMITYSRPLRFRRTFQPWKHHHFANPLSFNCQTAFWNNWHILHPQFNFYVLWFYALYSVLNRNKSLFRGTFRLNTLPIYLDQQQRTNELVFSDLIYVVYCLTAAQIMLCSAILCYAL